MTADTSWMRFANCADLHPDLMFPRRGEDALPAKRVCAGCTVRDACLDYALTNGERYGIWGGMSERERRRLRRGQPRMPEHGTRRRYHRGCRCEDCREANTDYIRRNRAS